MKIVELDFFPNKPGRNGNGNLWTRKEMNKLYSAIKAVVYRNPPSVLFWSDEEDFDYVQPSLEHAIGIITGFDRKRGKIRVQLFSRKTNKFTRRAQEKSERFAVFSACIGTLKEKRKIIFEALSSGFFATSKKNIGEGAKR